MSGQRSGAETGLETGLEILSIAPTATIQDRGRVGLLRYGVTSSGAMDDHALAEGQALLGNGRDDAALEFAGMGGRFRAVSTLWLACSGAEMALRVNGTPQPWRQSFRLDRGDVVEIGAVREGVYGYLHVRGGFLTELVLGSRSTHLRAGLGHRPAAGQILPVAPQPGDLVAMCLPRPDHFDRRELRLLWGPQSDVFPRAERDRLLAATITVTPRRDRMGMRIALDSGPIHADRGLTIASDAINPGDIQVAGDGTPTVLLADRGSSGGYARIATLASADMAALAQIPAGGTFRFRLVSRRQAVEALARHRRTLDSLASKAMPVTRDPRDIPDLLSYNLVSGVTNGDDLDLD